MKKKKEVMFRMEKLNREEEKKNKKESSLSVYVNYVFLRIVFV